MKKTIVGLASLLITVLPCGPAWAWSHANRWGGSTWHREGSGSTTRSSAWGGSETHTYGEGTTATNRYGTTATHATGSGYTTVTNPYGGTAYHTPYYGHAYPAYHPPTTVDVYGSGCYDCGGWSTAGAAAAGAAVGMVAGAAMESSKTSTTTQTTYAMGAIYSTLPPGSTTINKGGTTYYVSGNTWFQPSYGANGVYYRVVPAP